MFTTNRNNTFGTPGRRSSLQQLEERGLGAGNNDPLRIDNGAKAGASTVQATSVPSLTPEQQQRSWENYKNSFANYLMPQNTPQRAARVYALSQNALDDVVGTYYNNSLKGTFNRNREASRARGEDAYMRHISVPGADPVGAQNAMMREYDPEKIVNETMNGVNDDDLVRMVAPLARYSGIDTQEYINSFVKPSLRNRLMNEFVEENRPKSSGEYVLRSSLSNSVTGMLANWGANNVLGSNTHSILAREGLDSYNAGRTENFLAGIGSLLVDAPVFSLLGLGSSSVVGKATSLATRRVASRVLAGRVGSGVTPQYATKIAERAITNRLSTRILQSAFSQGFTLGNYDLANSVANDILYSSNVDLGRAASAFGGGFATGGTLGVVGTPLRHAARGLTGGRRLAASTGILSAESAVFTASGEASKLLNGVDIEPIDLLYDFGESMATLGVMKATHWRPRGAGMKLDANGRLRPEYRLSRSEQAELRQLNVNPEEFISRLERELNISSYGGGRNSEAVTEDYIRLMSSEELSASTRAKLLFVVENKLTSTPPLTFDFSVEQGSDNKWYVTTYDFAGRKIERNEFDTPASARSYFLVEKSNIRRNRIAAFEYELTSGLDSQNFLRQAGLYAQEKGIAVDEISDILYRRAKGEALNSREADIVGDILSRSSYNETGMAELLSNKRRQLERKHSLPENSLLYAIEKSAFRCTEAENRALDEYLAFVGEEVNRLKSGTNELRSLVLSEMGSRSRLAGLSNNDIWDREVESYRSSSAFEREPYFEGTNRREDERVAAEKNESRNNGQNSRSSFVKPIEIPETDNGYAWNMNGARNTEADMEEYRLRATSLSERFGQEVNFINNERDIPRPQAGDIDAVDNYNTQLAALGWLHNGKIYINLPNIRSTEELEKTFVHEVVGHLGLERLFGKHLNNFLEEIYRRASGDVLRGINEMQRRYNSDKYRAVEEYLAHLVEKTSPSVQERGLLRRFKDFVRGMLLRLNIYTGSNRRISEADLEFLLRQHSRYMQKRIAPENYRRTLFGNFNSALRPEATYTSREAYGNWVREGIADGSFFANTPENMLEWKGLFNYRYLPEEKQAELRDMLNFSHDDIMNYVDANKLRLPSEDAPAGGGERPSAPRNTAQEYDMYTRNVLSNLFGVNTRLSQRYNEARRILSSFTAARNSMPGFDADGNIAAEFKREYGFSPEEFRRNFPTFDDYLLYRLTGRGLPGSTPAEPESDFIGYGMGVAVKREPAEESNGYANDNGRRNYPPIQWRRYFNGPLDIIYDKMLQTPEGNPSLPQFYERRENGMSTSDIYDNMMQHNYFNNYDPRREEGYGWYNNRRHRIEYDRELRNRRRGGIPGENEEDNLPN